MFLFLPSETMFIICMLCLGVQLFVCLDGNVKLLSVNNICLCPCPISYIYKLYFFTNLGISILIPSNIPSSFDGFVESDLSLCLTRCSQPLVLPVPVSVNALPDQI